MIDTSSESLISSSDEEVKVTPKRYKLPLQLGYKPSSVSRQTQRKWEQRAAAFANKSLSKATSNTSKATNETDNTFETAPSEPDNLCTQAVRSIIANNDNDQIIDGIPSPVVNADDSPQVDEDYVVNSSEEHDILEEFISSESDIDDIQSEVDDGDQDDDYDDDSDGEDIFINQKIDFLDRMMFPESQLKVRDVIVMLTAISIDLKVSDQGKLKLAKFAKTLAGKQFDNLNLSKHMMDKCFSRQDECVTYHFYCSSCSSVKVSSVKATEKRKSKEVICRGCSKKNRITAKSQNYFLSVDLKYQFELLLSDPNTMDDVLNNVRSRNLVDGNVSKDVNCGSIHKHIMANTINNESNITLTVNMNTDGAPLTKSGKRGFWPVQVILNDLSPKLRFRHVLLAGLLLTESEPKSNLLNIYLLESYVNQINQLYEEGIEITHRGENIVFKFCTLACPVDSVCRPIVQNRVQFNGYYGCSWGYQKGEYIHSAHGVRYPVNQSDIERTNESHRQDVEASVESGRVTNGVKGDSAMSRLPHHDMVWSYPYEYLHGLCGVVLQIWNEFKNGEAKLSKHQVDFIEQRFLNITPTHDIHRLPRRGVIKGSAKPKAAELKSWLLLYSLPCLKNVISDDALKHYSLLVSSAYTALKPAQTDEELDKCDDDLLSFEVGYEERYGKDNMTFNVHTLRHIVTSIRKTGSLCYNSAFPFESNIYTLKTYVNGPNGMDRQISRKHLQYIIFKTNNIEHISSSDIVKQFCSSLFNPIRFSKSFHHGLDIVYCGKSMLKYMPELGDCLLYNRCIYKNTIYHSEKYVQAKKTNDSNVKLTSGEYAKIINIIECNGKSYVQLRLFNMFLENPFNGVDHIKQIISECENKIVREFNNIDCKVILVNARNARYLCTMPNDFEIQ